MTHPGMTIGALAGRTGTNVPTIRYYEQIGLLPEAQRASNGRRLYREADVTRLGFVKRCRDFGFPIEQVREMARLFEEGGGPCAEVRDLAQAQLEAVRVKIDAMRRLEGALEDFVASCNASCCAGTTRDCVIIGELTAAPERAAFHELRRGA